MEELGLGDLDGIFDVVEKVIPVPELKVDTFDLDSLKNDFEKLSTNFSDITLKIKEKSFPFFKVLLSQW